MLRYSISTVWDSVRIKHASVPWFSLIWKAPSIPKHSMIAWLVVVSKLTFKCDNAKWGSSLDISCLLCDKGVDKPNHVFHGCDYIGHIMEECMYSIMPYRVKTWNERISYYSRKFSNSSTQSKAGRILWRSIISNVWYERCRRQAG
ncbi:hypothetical protein LINPERHAP2_LOCUS22968 [Linum perenne]